jgi:hypothetical protein
MWLMALAGGLVLGACSGETPTAEEVRERPETPGPTPGGKDAGADGLATGATDGAAAADVEPGHDVTPATDLGAGPGDDGGAPTLPPDTADAQPSTETGAPPDAMGPAQQVLPPRTVAGQVNGLGANQTATVMLGNAGYLASRTVRGGEAYRFQDVPEGIYFLKAGYEIRVVLPVGSAPGKWGLQELLVRDKAGNTRTYNFVETLQFMVAM